jgi:hypothetical protein
MVSYGVLCRRLHVSCASQFKFWHTGIEIHKMPRKRAVHYKSRLCLHHYLNKDLLSQEKLRNFVSVKIPSSSGKLLENRHLYSRGKRLCCREAVSVLDMAACLHCVPLMTLHALVRYEELLPPITILFIVRIWVQTCSYKSQPGVVCYDRYKDKCRANVTIVFLSCLNIATELLPSIVSKLKLRVCFLYVCCLIAREGMNRFPPNLACLFLEIRKRTREGKNSRKVSWVWFPARAVPVARKLSTIEKRRQDKICLVWRGDCRDKNNPKNLSWFRYQMKTMSVAMQQSTIEERRLVSKNL